jgi:hypothetical protein
MTEDVIGAVETLFASLTSEIGFESTEGLAFFLFGG